MELSIGQSSKQSKTKILKINLMSMVGIKRQINSLKINNESFDLLKTTFTTKLIWNNIEFKENKNGFIPKNELYFILLL